MRPNVPSFVLLPRLASRLPPSPRLRYPAQLLAAATLAQAAATGLLPCPGFSHPAPATWLLLPCSSCCHLAAAGHPAQCPPGCSYIYPAPAASWLLLPPRPSYCHPAAATRLLPPGCCHPAALPCTSCLLLLPCPALAACCCQPATLTRLRPSYCHLPPPQLLPPGCCHRDAASWTLLLPPGCSAATRLLCCHPATLLPPGCSAATRLLCCHPAALLPPGCSAATCMLPPCPSCYLAATLPQLLPPGCTVLLLLSPGCALLPPCPCLAAVSTANRTTLALAAVPPPLPPCPAATWLLPLTMPLPAATVLAAQPPYTPTCNQTPSQHFLQFEQTHRPSFLAKILQPTMPSDKQPSTALSHHHSCRTYNMSMNQPTHHPAAGPNLLSYTISQDRKRETYSRPF